MRGAVVEQPCEAEPLEPLDRVCVESVVEAGSRERLVETEPEEDALPSLNVSAERLELAGRPIATS